VIVNTVANTVRAVASWHASRRSPVLNIRRAGQASGTPGKLPSDRVTQMQSRLTLASQAEDIMSCHPWPLGVSLFPTVVGINTISLSGGGNRMIRCWPPYARDTEASLAADSQNNTDTHQN
jgi:hypothetical protein